MEGGHDSGFEVRSEHFSGAAASGQAPDAEDEHDHQARGGGFPECLSPEGPDIHGWMGGNLGHDPLFKGVRDRIAGQTIPGAGQQFFL